MMKKREKNTKNSHFTIDLLLFNPQDKGKVLLNIIQNMISRWHTQMEREFLYMHSLNSHLRKKKIP